MSETPVQVAREHVAKGEGLLAAAEGQIAAAAWSSTWPNHVFAAMNVAVANAHFSAAMAITNIELTVEPDLG